MPRHMFPRLFLYAPCLRRPSHARCLAQSFSSNRPPATWSWWEPPAPTWIVVNRRRFMVATVSLASHDSHRAGRARRIARPEPDRKHTLALAFTLAGGTRVAPHETREANNAGLDCRVTNRVSERVSEKNNGPAPWNGSPCSHGQPQSLPCWLINYSVDACPWLLDGDVFRSASAP